MHVCMCVCVCVCVCVCTRRTVLWTVPFHAELRVSPKEVNVLFTDVPSRWIHRRAAVSAETALQIKWGKRERRGRVRSWKRVPMFRIFFFFPLFPETKPKILATNKSHVSRIGDCPDSHRDLYRAETYNMILWLKEKKRKTLANERKFKCRDEILFKNFWTNWFSEF